MDGKITYHQQVSYCGKPRCRRCREGIGHGPYWYSYQTVDGHTVRSYVGKNLPAGALQDTLDDEQSRRGAPELAGTAAGVRLYVLGQFTLERREGQANQSGNQGGQRWQVVADAALQHQRVRALLTCLISSPGRKLGREQIIELLWPELDFETANHRLDKAVHSLRQLFEPARNRPATSHLLLTEHAVLQLTEQAQLWVDADAFDSLLSQARASSDPGTTEQLLEEAALLYGGEYLPDERSVPWVQARRESLQRSLIGLLLDLADLRLARKAIAPAIDTLDRLLSIDPTNEAAVQRLVLLLAQEGRRGEALRLYQRFATLLKQEYRMAPLPETRALYEATRRGVDNTSGASGIRASDALLLSQDTVHAPDAEPRLHMQVGRSNQRRLVGREQELATLQRLLRNTEQARRMKLAGRRSGTAPFALDTRRAPQCVLLMGDVGIGKTRLAEELGREAARHGWTVAWTRAYAQENSIPYRVWTETLRKAMNQGLWQRQEITRHPLIYQSLRALLPELEELLPPVSPFSPAAISPEQEQPRLWDAARALLATISESAPLLIVLDDLQWSDGSSCELLAYLVRQLRDYPILIAGTCRDIELPATHPLRAVLHDLQREQAVEVVNVQPLTDDQIRVLVSGLPEPAVQHIQSRAAGNPFFAEELARNVEATLSTHSLPTPPDSLAVSVPLAPLPDTISAVLDLRLGRISNACRRLLVRATALGGSFEFAMLLAMESGSTALDEDTMLDLLEEALRAGMLTEEGSGTHITYHFWHPLLVSHLYDSLSAGRRASLHRRAAEVLQAAYRGREAESAATITYHLAQGGADPARIAHFAELAGDRAYALSAYPEAARYYRLAVEHNGTTQAQASATDHLRLANLLERLGECTRVIGNDDDARGYFEQALEARRQYRLAASPLDDQYEAQVDALLWVEIGKTWFDRGDNDHARQCFSQGELALREANISTGAAWAGLRLHQVSLFWQEGNFEEARQTAREALKIFADVLQQHVHIDANAFHSTAIRRTLEGDPVDTGRAHLLLGNIAAVMGASEEALEHLKTALAIFEQHERQREIAFVWGNIGDVHLRKADHPNAQAALRHSLGIAERIGDVAIMSVAYGNLGILATRLGELVEAEEYFNSALSLAEQVSDPVYISLIESYLTPVLQDQGKLKDARAAMSRALLTGRSTKFAPCIGFSLIALGQLRTSQALLHRENSNHLPEDMKRISPGQLLVRAKSSLQHALALEGLEAETRTEGRLALARAAFLLGEIDSAQEQVQEVVDQATRLEQAWLLAGAQRLLGNILSTQGLFQEADACFIQALEILLQCGMRLEWARTMYIYGESLFYRTTNHAQSGYRDQGLSCLREARQVFEDCHAALDITLVDQALASFTALPTGS